MLKKPFTLEKALFVLALCFALGMRFINLGVLSLSDYEAKFALEALNISNGIPVVLGSNPGYTHLTTMLFFLLGGADFWARFWPALAGAGMVLVAWFLRPYIGRIPALVLVFGLAFDPGLNAISRLAGGPVLAVCFLTLAGVFWLTRNPIPAGIFFGLTVLSGPGTWFGLVTVLVAWGLWRAIPAKFFLKSNPGEEQDPAGITVKLGAVLKETLLWAVGTFLLIGTLMTLSPQGLAAMVRSILEYAGGWWHPSGVPFWRVLLALPAYELLPLLFGITQMIRGFISRDRVTLLLSLWLFVSLLLVCLYPGRQVFDLCWALIPLWILAAREIGRYFYFFQANRWVVGGVITAIFVLLVLAWLTLARISTFNPASPDVRLQWLFIGGILLVIIISLVMVATGWSLRDAWLGGVWGFLIPLFLFTFGAATGSAGLRDPRTIELWNPEPRLGRADIVLKVLKEISFINTGLEESLPVKIIAVDSPALEWLFHKWDVEKMDIFDPAATPPLLITSDLTELDLTADYRGEPIVWQETAEWDTAGFSNWLQWFLYRQMPVQQTRIVLWVRSDQFLQIQDDSIP